MGPHFPSESSEAEQIHTVSHIVPYTQKLGTHCVCLSHSNHQTQSKSLGERLLLICAFLLQSDAESIYEDISSNCRLIKIFSDCYVFLVIK